MAVTVIFTDCAWVDRRLAVRAVPAACALARVSRDFIGAGCAILAGAGGTLIDIGGAVGAAPARSATARVGIDGIGA